MWVIASNTEAQANERCVYKNYMKVNQSPLILTLHIFLNAPWHGSEHLGRSDIQHRTSREGNQSSWILQLERFLRQEIYSTAHKLMQNLLVHTHARTYTEQLLQVVILPSHTKHNQMNNVSAIQTKAFKYLHNQCKVSHNKKI